MVQPCWYSRRQNPVLLVQTGSSGTGQRAHFLCPQGVYCLCAAPVRRTAPRRSQANAAHPAYGSWSSSIRTVTPARARSLPRRCRAMVRSLPRQGMEPASAARSAAATAGLAAPRVQSYSLSGKSEVENSRNIKTTTKPAEFPSRLIFPQNYFLKEFFFKHQHFSDVQQAVWSGVGSLLPIPSVTGALRSYFGGSG